VSPAKTLEFYYLKDIQSNKNPTGKWHLVQQPQQGSEERSFVFVGPNGKTIDSIKQPKEVLSEVVQSAKNPPVLTNRDILATASVATDRYNRTVVNIQFNGNGTKIFRDFTARHIEEDLAIFYRGKLLMAPRINDAVSNGRVEISGNNVQQAQDLVEAINSDHAPK
jgi:preprotein translocase subunit SecD